MLASFIIIHNYYDILPILLHTRLHSVTNYFEPDFLVCKMGKLSYICSKSYIVVSLILCQAQNKYMKIRFLPKLNQDTYIHYLLLASMDSNQWLR